MATTDNNGIKIKNRDRVVKEIAKTSESIRKKYRALKTGQMEENMILERQLKPITEPLKQIAENTDSMKSDTSLEQIVAESENVTAAPEKYASKRKKLCTTKRKASNVSIDDPIQASTPIEGKRRRLNIYNDVPLANFNREMPCEPSSIHSPPADEDVYETTNNSFITSVRRELQTLDGQELLRTHFGELGQKYVGKVLCSDKDRSVDDVYGIYFADDGTTMMLGDKRFDVDKDDNILIGDVRYAGTPGIYELIFKRIPDDTVYTEADTQKYKDILLATNAHRRRHDVRNPVLSNKGYKYKHVIAPLLSKKKIGQGLTAPRRMILNNNSIDYVYWNDPNELVDRLRLLEASRHAGNNAHNNEFLSIIEELREAGIIIN